MKASLRAFAVLLVLSGVAAAPFDSGFALAHGKQDQAARLQKKIEECSRHVSERFVFFGGGSGVLISEDGFCLTNHHVAGQLPTTRVTLHSGKTYAAKMVCTDALGDLSLFKIDAGEDKLPFIQMGDSDKLEMGQYVVACGNPFGITQRELDSKWYPTITLGIVSAVHRNQQTYFDCIQTDAAVNPGNSGGPLVTLDGKLVGINGRIATRYMNRVNSGVGYAIPSNQIKNFLPEMRSGGTEGKAYHGQIKGLAITTSPTDGQGARVAGVKTGTTAHKAGFQTGDMIIRVNKSSIFNRERFLGAMGTYPENSEITVTVLRDGEEVKLPVTLDRFLDGQYLPTSNRKARGYLGAKLEEKREGLTVDYVEPGSPADNCGLREGDLLVKLEGLPVRTADEVIGRIAEMSPGDALRLTVKRGAETLDLKAIIGRRND
jgi:serine protease Do